MTVRLLLLLFALAGLPAAAQPASPDDRPFIAGGLAEEVIEVQLNFTGSQVVLFTTAPQPENETSGLVVALIGPIAPQTMYRRTPSGEQTIEFVSAPRVFVVGSEQQVARTVSQEALIEAGLDAGAAAIPRSDQLTSPYLPAWRGAFVRLKRDEGLYAFNAADIKRFDGGLRRATIDLPINAPPGQYRVRAVAFRNGEPVGETEQVMTLVRSGLDATLFDLSRQHGLIYGLLAVMLGVIVGGVGAWFGRK